MSDEGQRRCYMGIADDMGLECFIPCASAMQSVMHQRAQANRHRNALVYRCIIEEKSARKILTVLEDGSVQNCKFALLALKHMSEAGKATVEVEQSQSDAWDIIPRGDPNDIVAEDISKTLDEQTVRVNRDDLEG